MRSSQLRRRLTAKAVDIGARIMRFSVASASILFFILFFVSMSLALCAHLRIWLYSLEAISLESRLAGRNKSRRAQAQTAEVRYSEAHAVSNDRMRHVILSGNSAFFRCQSYANMPQMLMVVATDQHSARLRTRLAADGQAPHDSVSNSDTCKPYTRCRSSI